MDNNKAKSLGSMSSSANRAEFILSRAGLCEMSSLNKPTFLALIMSILKVHTDDFEVKICFSHWLLKTEILQSLAAENICSETVPYKNNKWFEISCKTFPHYVSTHFIYEFLYSLYVQIIKVCVGQ